MPDYCYVKKYEMNSFGGSILINPEPMEKYKRSRYDLLMSAHGDRTAQREIYIFRRHSRIVTEK